MASAPTPLQLRPNDLNGLGGLQALNTFLRQTHQRLTGAELSWADGQPRSASIVSQSVSTTDWVTISAFQNSWAPYPGFTIRLSKLPGGLVQMQGVIRNGTINTTAFLLPTGYGPAQEQDFAIDANGAFGSLVIGGDVRPASGATNYFSLSSCWIAADPTPVPNLSAPITFNHGLQGACTDLIATATTDVSNPQSLVPPFQINWVDNGNGTVTVSAMPGLAPAKKYAVRFLCLGSGE